MTGPSFPPYRTRAATFVELRSVGGWRVKVYTIDARATTRIEPSWNAAMEKLPLLLPTDPGGSGAYGEAFAILHAGEDAIWLLVHWWADTCLLHHRIAAAAPDSSTSFDVDIDRTLVACSWKLAVIAHERDAWVRTVQSRGADADFEAYRTDVMAGTDV